MRTRTLVFVVGLGLGALAASCSFTTASGFNECTVDTDCAASSVCVKQYCLPMPAGCQRAEGSFDKADRIPLATIVTLTNPDGGPIERETYRLNALKLALSEANKFGGLKNSPYALIACNSPADDTSIQSVTAWLVQNLSVPAIVVSRSGPLRAASAEPNRLAAGTFLISANATSASLVGTFQRDGNVWRVAPPDTLQARVLRELVTQALVGTPDPDAGVVDGGTVDAGARSLTVAIVNESTDYGGGLQLALNDELTQAGFTVKTTPFDPPLSAATAAGVASSLASNAPAATIVIGFPPDVVQVVTAAKSFPVLQLANGHRWFFTDSAKDPAILTATTADQLEGLTGTTPAQGVGTAFRTFRDSFTARYGVDPSAYSFTAHTYDAMWLTLASTAWAQHSGAVTGPAMREGMLNVSSNATPTLLLGAKWSDVSAALLAGTPINADGSSGDLQFDPDAGAPSGPYEVWTVRDAGITTVRLATP
jgi:branched-chain amino acid transport system substrate-binding protein